MPVIFSDRMLRSALVDFSKNGIPNPFTQDEFVRIVWGLPAAYWAIASAMMGKFNLADKEDELKTEYLEYCCSLKGQTIPVKEKIVTPRELEFIYNANVLRYKSFFGGRSSGEIDSNILLALVSTPRKVMYSRSIYGAVFPYGHEQSFLSPHEAFSSERSRAYDAMSAIGIVTAIGREIGDDTRMSAYMIGIYSHAYPQIHDALSLCVR